MDHVEKFYAEGGVPNTKLGNTTSYQRTAEVDSYEQAIADGDAKLADGSWAWFVITKAYVAP